MRIIAVDDRPMPRRALVHAILEAAPDAQVVECASADEVLALEALDSFDVAFVDIDMPGKSGLQLARELKATHPLLNIVFATGFGEYMADAFALHSSGYLMKPITADKVRHELEDLRHPPAPQDSDKLFVRCFGDFEVFAHGKPVAFNRAKSKELFAFLVDRQGSVVSMGTIEAAIWGDVRSRKVSGSYLRTLIVDLKRTLETCGYGDLIVRRYGEVGIRTELIDCDLYNLWAGDPLALASWRGEYMNQYSWAEATKAALIAKLAN